MLIKFIFDLSITDVLIRVVPLLVMFFTKFLSFCRKERKAPQSFFALWSMLPMSKEEAEMPGFTDST
ncbi:hypothetical protein C7N43_24880 [Sphingobacteriales bacterium UPWRP_1]|nr:hypothetical protein BVG80_11085 [Sphingobacteriales bacterium TSM_CSM]PSJ74253.1 hypothetical protein C7N43_24880 [Sphingobacteriales bacterium UPWRP_1]